MDKAFVVASILLSFFHAGSFYALHNLNAGSKKDAATATDKFLFEMDSEHLDLATNRNRVAPDGPLMATFLKLSNLPANHRVRRQVVIENPVEEVRCRFSIQKCKKENGTCINNASVNVCKGPSPDDVLDLDSKVCANADRSSTSPIPCPLENCWRETHTGRCLSLRGGTKACKGDGDPGYLIPGAQDCQ